jgi:PAS domain S-box-containing protein/putative nucleotidyltransferase with HDIG domain
MKKATSKPKHKKIHRAYKDLKKTISLERNLLQSLLDNIPDAIYFKDDKNRIIRVNRFYAEGFKLAPEDIIGKTDFDFFPKDQAQRMFDDDTYILQTGKPIIGKIERTLLPNGTLNCVTTTKIPIKNKKNKTIGTIGVTRDITAYDNTERTNLEMIISSLKVLDKILETKDPYTFGHTRRVSLIAERIAKEMAWDENRILELKMSAELHDIGKILIPLEILNKPGKLSDLEYRMVQEHVQQSYDMLKPYSFPTQLPEAIYQHHERLDGTGYPRSLSSNKILPEAKILAICDVLEAMISHRPYRQALGMDVTLQELRNNAGSKYDKDVVDIVLKIINENDNKPFWLTSENLS